MYRFIVILHSISYTLKGGIKMCRYQEGIGDTYDYTHDERDNYTHKGLAFNTLEQLLIGRERGFRLKHPIQIIADLILKESERENRDTITELMMETGEKLLKFYSKEELDHLCLAVMMANNNDGINDKYIEVVSS